MLGLGRVYLCALVAATFGFSGCVQVNEPDPPTITIPENSTGCDKYCECDAADVQGRAYRVTSLQIDEPEAFATILNEMWAGDIRNNVLNVIFNVEQAVPGTTGSAFNSLKISAGPSWRVPKEPWTNPAPGDDPPESIIDSYCQLKGMAIPLELKPYRNLQCTFKSTEMSSLYFHSGPKDMPFICAPQNEVANNIPIKNLKIRATFNRDCTEIADGYLEGCIAVDAADNICMCPGGAGVCDRALPIDSTPDVYEAAVTEAQPKTLGDYCHAVCGKQWISFGALIHSFGLEPTCLTVDGIEGYRVQGFFTAIDIPGQFNPVQSDDCSVTQ